MTSRIYGELEAGIHLPDEPECFIEALIPALGMCEHEALGLLRAYAHSVLEAELEPEIAARVLTRSRGARIDDGVGTSGGGQCGRSTDNVLDVKAARGHRRAAHAVNGYLDPRHHA